MSLNNSDADCVFDYHWADADFIDRQVEIISKR